jgi:HD-GYP domain-containing protein (c-di-GMP phosphodiesterase class II)
MTAGTAVQEFIAIPLEALRPETVLGFDLYIQHRGGETVLYRAAEMEFTETIRQRLVSSGVETLKVPADQAAAFRRYCEQTGQAPAPSGSGEPTPSAAPEIGLVDIARNLDIPLDRRAEHVATISRQVVESAFQDLGSPGLSQRVHSVAEAQAALLVSEPQAYQTLVARFRIDFELYSHMVHTSFYAMELGRAVGLDELDEMANLGRAALVHDVGMAEMSAPLITKDPRAMSDVEWAEMMAHPERGVSMLQEAGWDDATCLDVCAHHHERCDGSGYPQGVSGDQISLSARIVGIADAFDDLTSSRADRPEMSGFQALWTMKRELRGQFDDELIDRFVHVMTAPALAR